MNGRQHVMRLACALLCSLVLASCSSPQVAEPVESPVAHTDEVQEEQNESAYDEAQPAEVAQDEERESEKTMDRMTITINGQRFEAELEDSDCGRAFAALLPQELAMSELNGNEKYCYTGTALPSSPTNPGRIEAGDLMLYGSDCVVLFYESFNTSYRYTRIGRITDPEGIAEAVGAGSATVAFEAAEGQKGQRS